MQTLLVGGLICLLILLGGRDRSCVAQVPAPRGELRIVDKRPDVGQAIVPSVVEYLVEIDHDGRLVPRLASSWQWRDDRTLVMTLRQGVTFHNGEAFDAAIVKRNWDEYIEFRESWGPEVAWWTFEARLELLDPYTVQFVLPEPDSAALVKLGVMPILNRQFWRETMMGGFFGTYFSLGPWGTGPYKWVEGYAIAGAPLSPRIVLEANLAYWDAVRLPRLQRIVFDNTLTRDEALELVKTSEGRVDLVVDLRPLETLRVAQSPLAKVVKERGGLRNVFGLLNMYKPGSPWRDLRLRQAVNYAINREDFIRYAAKGNGIVIPALLPTRAFGYDPQLTPYPFDPATARRLLSEAGYASGLALTLIAPETLEVQATVVSKMLEQVGFTVRPHLLDADTFVRRVTRTVIFLGGLVPDWDIALDTTEHLTALAAHSPALLYRLYTLGGAYDWADVQPELHRLYDQLLRTVERDQQQLVIRQMEQHTRDQAYFLFLYNIIQLYAVNKAVEFVPHPSGAFWLAETTVTEQHWSVRGAQKAAGAGQAPVQE